jgi:hypothetical protein
MRKEIIMKIVITDDEVVGSVIHKAGFKEGVCSKVEIAGWLMKIALDEHIKINEKLKVKTNYTIKEPYNNKEEYNNEDAI